MFSYCNNNPVNLVDFSGSIPRELIGIFPYTDGGSRGGSYIPVNYGNFENTKEISYQSNGTNNGAQIIDSYKVTNPITMYKHIRENRGDEIAGSTVGVVHEWVVHNIAYGVGNFAVGIGLDEWGNNFRDKGQTLDVGRTIYDDSHGWFSLIMWITYGAISPFSAGYDFYIYKFK